MKATKFLAMMTFALSVATTSAQTISTEYAQPGIGGVILEEFERNPALEVLNIPVNSMMAQAGTSIREREQWLNGQNTGVQILASYISDKTSLEKLKHDIRKSITQADLDMAALSGLGEDAMVADILTRRLANNYIFFTDKDPVGRTTWELYKIQLTPELYNAYLNTLGTNEPAPLIPMKFIKSGYYDQRVIDNEYQKSGTPESAYAVFRRLAKEVPDLAPGGPVISSHPFRARIPKSAEKAKRQRYYIYRTVEKDGLLTAKNIGTALVTRIIGQDTIQLYSIYGRTGSRKRGDYAVYTPGGLNAFSISGLYGIEKNGNFPRIRIEYDGLGWLSPVGISGHGLVALDFDIIGKSGQAFDLENGKKCSYIRVSKGKAYAVDPTPYRVGFALGYGVAYNFMGRFAVMPYFRIGGTYTSFFSPKKDNLLGNISSGKDDGIYFPEVYDDHLELSKNKAHFWGMRGDLGARLNINFSRTFSFFLGAEYNYYKGFGKKSTGGISAADYFYKKDYLGHGNTSLNLLIGFRFISF